MIKHKQKCIINIDLNKMYLVILLVCTYIIVNQLRLSVTLRHSHVRAHLYDYTKRIYNVFHLIIMNN